MSTAERKRRTGCTVAVVGVRMGMRLHGVEMVGAAVDGSGGRQVRMRCRVISNTRSLHSLTKHIAEQ